MLIRLEIEGNLRRLRSFWAEVNGADGLPEREVLRELALAHRIVDMPLSAVSRFALDTQLGQLAEGLDERMVGLVIRVYEGMMRLQTLRESLRMAADEQRSSWELASGGTGTVMGAGHGLSRAFDKIAVEVWKEFKATAEQLLSEDNPLSA